MERAEVQVKIAQIIARAWVDGEFKSRLKRDTRAALSEMGLDLHPGVNMTVVEDVGNDWYLYIPPAPEETKESIAPLMALSPGGSSSSGQCCKCHQPCL